MTTLRASLRDYLAMRRGLGFKLHDAGAGLLDFVSFMEGKRTSRITTRLALEWAQKSKSTLPMDSARRLSFVRGFARYLNAIDSRSEIPPNGLLPYRPREDLDRASTPSDKSSSSLQPLSRFLRQGVCVVGRTIVCLVFLPLQVFASAKL